MHDIDAFLDRVQRANNPAIRKDPSEGEEDRSYSGAKPNSWRGGDERQTHVEPAEMIVSTVPLPHLSLHTFSAHTIRILYVFNTVVHRFRRPRDDYPGEITMT